jgi:iron complex outermembrane receptor protein
MMKRSFKTPITISSVLVLMVLCSGITEASPGSVVGRVRGPAGVGLPGAIVTFSSAERETMASVVTGDDGAFRVDGLDSGTYTVDARMQGFHSTSAADIVVESGTAVTVELALSVATFHDTMQVDSISPRDSLEASELRQSGARDLGEALSGKAGVWKARKGGIANDVILKGFHQDDITVLIDGARIAGACPNRMDPPVFHLDFAEVDRVELETSSGRMAAQGSMGGLVSVVTKKPGQGLHADASLIAGSWNMVNPSATVSFGTDRFAVLGGLSHRSSEPYTDGSGTVFTEVANYTSAVEGLDAFDVMSVWTRLYFEPAEGHELHLSYARQEADDVLYPVLMMDAVTDDTDRLVAGYRYVSGSGFVRAVRATAYATRVDHWMVDTLRATAGTAPRGWSMGTNATTEMLGMTAEAELGQVVLGLEAYQRNWDAWTEMAGMGYMPQFSIPDVDVDVFGLSARWKHAFGPQTLFEVGGRVDKVTTTADSDKANTNLYYAYHGIRDTSRSDTEPSLSLRLVHNLSSAFTLNGSVARTVRSPDPRERYFGLKKKNADWVGYPDLAPPVSTGGELGLVWNAGSGVLTASVWSDRVDDYIIVYSQERINMAPGVMNPQAQSYANVDAHLRGFSVEGSVALSSRVFLSGSATYVRGTQEAIPELRIYSTNLAEMPPLSGRLVARWQNTKFFGEVEGVAAASQNKIDEDLSETATPGWGIVNLKTGYNIGPWRFQVILANLFDHNYREHFSYLRNPFRSGFVVNEPGRNISLTIGWSH